MLELLGILFALVLLVFLAMKGFVGYASNYFLFLGHYPPGVLNCGTQYYQAQHCDAVRCGAPVSGLYVGDGVVRACHDHSIKYQRRTKIQMCAFFIK